MQLSWLIHGGRRAKRVLTRWLHQLPPTPDSAGFHLLSQARQVTVRHLAQLEQLSAGLELSEETVVPGAGIAALLAEAERSIQDRPPEAAVVGSIHRISACFATACATAAESAMQLNRIDLAAVLVSWAAASAGLPHPAGADATGTAPMAHGPVTER